MLSILNTRPSIKLIETRIEGLRSVRTSESRTPFGPGIVNHTRNRIRDLISEPEQRSFSGSETYTNSEADPYS